ncbi:VUT family protein [Streptomyces sp. NPDC001705]
MNTESRVRAPLGALLICLAYLGTIPAANWMVTNLAPIPLGFDQAAPAGVCLAGLSLALRDWVREVAGIPATLAAMGAGVGLSYLMADPRFATASVVAFAVAEALDFLVYEPLRKRGLIKAVAWSGAVGLVADSLLFLWLAFGDMQFLPGQVAGKAAMTLLAVAAMVARRRYAAR